MIRKLLLEKNKSLIPLLQGIVISAILYFIQVGYPKVTPDCSWTPNTVLYQHLRSESGGIWVRNVIYYGKSSNIFQRDIIKICETAAAETDICLRDGLQINEAPRE